MQDKRPSTSPGQQGRWFWSMLVISVAGHAALLALPMMQDSHQEKSIQFYNIGFRKLVSQPAVVEKPAVENTDSNVPPKQSPQTFKKDLQSNRSEKRQLTVHARRKEKPTSVATSDMHPSPPVHTATPRPVKPVPAAPVIQPSPQPVAVRLPLTASMPAEDKLSTGTLPATKPQAMTPQPLNAGRTGPPPQAAVVAPTYMKNPRPTYPPLARQRGWQGDVLLRVFVNTAGHVTAVRLEQSSGHRVLDRSAMKQIRNWRFRPASRGAAKIDGEVTVPVHFRLKRS